MKVTASQDTSVNHSDATTENTVAAATAPTAKESNQQPATQQKTTPGSIRAPESRRKLVSVDNAVFMGAIGGLKRQASSSSVEENDSAPVMATKRNKHLDEGNAGMPAVRHGLFVCGVL